MIIDKKIGLYSRYSFETPVFNAKLGSKINDENAETTDATDTTLLSDDVCLGIDSRYDVAKAIAPNRHTCFMATVSEDTMQAKDIFRGDTLIFDMTKELSDGAVIAYRKKNVLKIGTYDITKAEKFTAIEGVLCHIIRSFN